MKELRNGFTTGSAVAAAAVAAFRRSAGPVELLLPGGGELVIPIHRQRGSAATVVKDGGDDPDVTTGAAITVALRPSAEPAEPADYVEKSDLLELVIRGGEGVGLVTRPGLAVPVGKAAINPTPRKMLLANLERMGCRGRYLVEIKVPGGAAIAGDTLNPTLGIVNGISILGNSGIVRPYSHAAYAATIVLQLNSLAASGRTAAALATGNRTAEALARDFPELPEDALVRIGDFIHVALKGARRAGLSRIVLGCMPGKLFKYACGEANTHAHRCKLTLAKLRDFGIELPGVELEKMDTMGELAARLAVPAYRAVLSLVYRRAFEVLQQVAGDTRLELALYDDAGRRIL